MVSQISSTFPGMLALCETGLFKSFILSLWDLLDSDPSLDQEWLDIDDHATKKIVCNILKSVSTFYGFSALISWEIKSQDPEQTKSSFLNLLWKLLGANKFLSRESFSAIEESHQVNFHLHFIHANYLIFSS